LEGQLDGFVLINQICYHLPRQHKTRNNEDDHFAFIMILLRQGK